MPHSATNDDRQNNGDRPRKAQQPDTAGTAADARDSRQLTAIEALQNENEALRDRMLRALAEVENMRRRAERGADEVRRYAVADFARDLLPVADNLQRAIVAAAALDEPGDATLIEGVRATQQTLSKTLQRFGIRKTEALHRPFDPALHEAMMETDDPEHAPGTVVHVMEDGYTINDRLLRPARVVVVKRPPSPEVKPVHS